MPDRRHVPELSCSRRIWFLASAGVGIVGAGLVAYLIVRPASPAEVGQRTLAALEARDGAALLRYVSQEEVSGLDLDAERLQCLLSVLIPPTVSAKNGVGKMHAEPNPSGNSVRVWREYAAGGDSGVAISVNVTTNTPRPQVANLIRVLINQRIGRDMASLPEADRENRRQAMARLFEQLAPELERCGLTGMPTLDRVRNAYVVEPWAEYVARLRGNGG